MGRDRDDKPYRDGGCRGGRNFKWEDVKFDKDRDLYLGVSVKAPIGKWAQGRDVCWYQKPSELDKIHIEKKKEEKTKEPKHKHKHHHHHHHKHKHHHKHRSSSSSSSSDSEKEEEKEKGKDKSKKSSKISDEIAEIKRKDEEAMLMRLLGKNKMNNQNSKLEKGEMKMLLQKGKLETDQFFVERTQGLGAAPTFSERDLNEEAKDEDDENEEKEREIKRKKAIPAPLVNPFGEITGERMSMDEINQRERSPHRRG